MPQQPGNKCPTRFATARQTSSAPVTPITLGPGDYARYSGDGPHVYRSADADCHGMLLVGYPPA